MSWPACPATDAGRQCEHKDGQGHTGKHVQGSGAFRVTWGGKVNLGPKNAAARAAAGLSPSKAPAARHCEHCMAPETMTQEGAEVAAKMVSNLDRGRCRDRGACLERAPQLDLGL